MKFSLPAFAIQRPIAVVMLVVTFLGMGAISATRLPIEFLPSIDLPYLGCFIPYPGANPSQVEQEIAIVAEGEFRTLSNLDRLYTNSSGNGCYVNISFKSGTDMTEALAEVRDRVERLRLVLPDEVQEIRVQHFSSDTLPVLAIGLFREKDPKGFIHLVRNVLLPKLQRLDGIAEVQVYGADRESILVEFDQNAMRRHSLSIFQVMSTLQTSSLNVSIGELTDGDTKYLVRALGEFKRPEELAELIVAPGLRLKDIAEVGYGSRDRDYRFALNGQEEVFLVMQIESDANTVAACQAMEEELDRVLATPEFEGVQKFLYFNQGNIILTAMDGLLSAGKYGGLMALCVLFLFLRRFRPTVIVALAIPGSLVGGLVFMFFAGISLNLVTMMSLIIAVGMVVDNSIVVVENIYRYRGLGYSLSESARRGASEVGLAITASTLTTAVVFIPVIFIDAGEMSIMMHQFAFPVTVSLGASLVIALTVIPLATSRFKDREKPLFPWLRGHTSDTNAPAVSAKRRRILGYLGPGALGRGLLRAYEGILRFSMRWRLVSTCAIALAIIGTYYGPVKNVGMQDMPTVDRRRVDLDVRLDQNYDMAMSTTVFEKLEGEIDSRRKELQIRDVIVNYSPRGGRIEIYLDSMDDLEVGESIRFSSEETMNILWQVLPDRFPGGRVWFSTGESSVGGGSSGQGKVSMLLKGDDLDTLDKYADRLIAVMESLPNVSEVDKNTRPPEKEIRLDVDEVLAERSGIDSTTVAQTVGFALQGRRLPPIKQGGREVDVWAQFRESDRKSRANLDNVMVQGQSGVLVPLNQLVTYSKADSPRSIPRRDGKNYIWVTAKTAKHDVTGVTADLRRIRDNFELPPGYSISLGDELIRMQEDVSNFLSTLLLAVILIYLVMSALFESWLLPLSILTTIPLAFMGVFWFMYLLDTPMDTVAFIGCILMVGIIVNNAIVIVDHINNLRKGGMPRFDAIIQAGKDRIRPVLMTALTTILGAVPLAIGGGPGSEVVSLGRALIGGLTVGTALTLFVVPLFYSFIDDLQTWFGQYFASLGAFGRRRAAN